MSNSIATVADFARQIQRLTRISSPTQQEENELKFYFQIVQKLAEIDGVNNCVPLELSFCLEDAQKWAKPLGMNIVQSSSGRIYLSWCNL